jgi:two-component system chemotaxis response regulator CheY
MTSTVLIVDDDPFIRRLIATTLEDVSGFDLIQAGDGEEALTLAEQTRPLIVFLDVDMPKLNGLDACRALREREEFAGTRIVMLTAGVEHERAAKDAGADLFLTKPFSPLNLLRMVDELAG